MAGNMIGRKSVHNVLPDLRAVELVVGAGDSGAILLICAISAVLGFLTVNLGYRTLWTQIYMRLMDSDTYRVQFYTVRVFFLSFITTQRATIQYRY
jgi:hypothetical protein